MLGDRPLVEGVGGAGQLDLAMQRLVGDAKQRAVRHAHAEALGGDGRRFHVDGDGARDVDEPPLLRPAQFPIAVVVGDDGAGAQAPLQRLAPVAGDLGHRLLQRDLHFGERRDRHHQRHRLVEDVVAPQIGVREHIVADHLRLPQAGAMADHQPAMRPQDRDVVGDGLGVRGPDADVDETDPAPVGAHAMIGGHLEPMPGDGAGPRLGLGRRDRRVDDDIARQNDLLDARSGVQLLQAPLDELVDIAVVVGEQHPRLHRPPVGAGIVHEAAQRIIDPRRVEQGERPLGAEVELAVRRLVADRGERGHGKKTREFGGVGAAARQLVAALDHIRVGDLLRADADLDRGAVFADQRLELLEQIGAELGRLRHRRRVDAGFAELGEGARARERRAVRRINQAQFGIAEQGARRARGRLAFLEKALDRPVQGLSRLVIEANEPVDRLAGLATRSNGPLALSFDGSSTEIGLLHR